MTLTATDSNGAHGSATFAWTVDNTVTVTFLGTQNKNSGTAITPLTLSATTSGAGGGAAISPTGWSVVSGSLPPGLTFSAGGVVSGTPTTSGSYVATVQATDSAGFTGTGLVIYSIDNVVTVTAPANQNSNAGSPITPVTVSAATSGAGGGATITGFSLTGAPPGLSISAAGVITGTPTTGGTFTVTVTATDSAAFHGTSSSFTWQINDVVTVTNPGAQTSTSGTAIATLTPTATVVGGGTITGWAESGLPPGLTFNATTGAVSGTPTTGSLAAYSVTLTATDNTGAHGSATFTWTVNNRVTVTDPGTQTYNSGSAITPLTLAATTSGSAGGATISATGWSLLSGSLPPGLTLSPAGVVTGTPTTAGSYSTDLQATDSAGFTGHRFVPFTIDNVVTVANPGPQTENSGTAITPLTLSATTSGAGGGATISPTGWSVLSGSLPPGLMLSAAGVVTGTPTTAGSYSAVVQATDSAGFTGSNSVDYTIDNVVTVADPGPQTDNSGTAITPLTLSATTSGAGGGATISATGWSLLSGSLPPGLTLSAAGVVTGTPTTAGSYSAVVQATDSAGFTGTANLDVHHRQRGHRHGTGRPDLRRRRGRHAGHRDGGHLGIGRRGHHHRLVAVGRPSGAVDLAGRCDHRYPHDGRDVLRHRDGHRLGRVPRHQQLVHLAGQRRGDRDRPR